MADLLSETVVYWDGSAVAETVGDVTRYLQGFLRFEAGDIVTPEVEMYGGVRLQTADPVQGAATAVLQLRGAYTGSSSDDAVRERAIRGDWNALGLRYNPHDGQGELTELRVDAVDTSAAATSRVALARVTRGAALQFVKGGDESDGARASAFYRATIPFYVPGGLWRNRTASTGTGTVNGSTNAVVLNNVGVKGCAVRVEWATISGTVTGFSIADTAGTIFTATHTTGFSAGDYVDFGYTTEGQLSVINSATIGVNVGGWWELAAGSASYDVTRTAGSGSGTLTISWRPLFYTW